MAGIKYLNELGENLQKIIKRLMANQTLMKYLYYTDKDPLDNPDLTEDEIRHKVYQKLIKIVPKLDNEEKANSVIALKVINGVKNPENQEFKNLSLGIEVFVPLSQWILKSDNLRPFLIMGEIQKSLEGKTINGLGRIEGGDFQSNFNTEEISAFEMFFDIVTYD